MVGIGKTPARPPQKRQLDLLERIDQVVPQSMGIGNLCVPVADIEATIHAVAKMFREIAVDVSVDRVSAQVSVDNDAGLGGGECSDQEKSTNDIAR